MKSEKLIHEKNNPSPAQKSNSGPLTSGPSCWVLIKFLQTLLLVPSMQHCFHQFNRLFYIKKKKLKKIYYKGFVTFISPRLVFGVPLISTNSTLKFQTIYPQAGFRVISNSDEKLRSVHLPVLVLGRESKGHIPLLYNIINACMINHRQPKRAMCRFALQRSFGRNKLELLVYYLMPNKCKNLKDMKSSCLSICTSSL